MPDITLHAAFPKPTLIPNNNDVPVKLLDIIHRWIPIGMASYNAWDIRPRCGHFFAGVYWYGQESSMPVTAIATALSANPGEERIAGFPREELEQAVVSAIRYLCFTHDTGPADCIRPSKGLGRPEPASTKSGEKGLGFFRESQCGVTIADLRGRRRLWWPDGNREFQGYVVGDATQDVTQEILAPADTSGNDRSVASPDVRFSWVNVDNQFTMAFAASGAARYENPHFFPVWHAVNDYMTLSACDAPMSAEPGQVVCEMLLSWVPEHSHEQAAEAVPEIKLWDGKQRLEARTAQMRITRK